jgi:hypothetical protein
MPSHLTARACSDQLISVSVAFDNNGCAKSICFGPSCRLMGKVTNGSSRNLLNANLSGPNDLLICAALKVRGHT